MKKFHSEGRYKYLLLAGLASFQRVEEHKTIWALELKCYADDINLPMFSFYIHANAGHPLEIILTRHLS